MENDKFEMIISDNGLGLKSNSNEGKGLGARLIQLFVKQLEGTINQLPAEGTSFKIIFKKID